eukprot:5768700-Pyramimonas_sp.AAC.1
MREPADWKRGFTAAFYNGKADSRCTESKRSAHFPNIVCKLHRGFMRSADFARGMVSSVVEAQLVARFSSSVLQVDIVADSCE